MSETHPTTDQNHSVQQGSLHTPGPWCVVGRETALEVVEARRHWMRVCFLTSDGACDANARLIAAAPDLLALARQYASECSGCDGRGFTVGDDGITGRGPDDVEPTRYACEDCEDIRAVIAKAEGKL